MFFNNRIFWIGLGMTWLPCLAAHSADSSDAQASLKSADPDISSDHISMSDPEVAKGLSLYNWVRTQDYVSSAGAGSSLKVAFSGTQKVILNVDPSNITTSVPSRYPVIAWSINDGTIQTHQLASGEKSITLCSDTADPVIDLYIKGMSPFENRYSSDVPANALKILGFNIDSGGKVVPTAFPAKTWLNIGDSIMSGDAADYATGQGRPPDDKWASSSDARASYGYLLAQHYGYRESRVAYGGYDWGGGLAGIPQLSTLIDQITGTVTRLDGDKLSPSPDVVLINLGENGTPPKSDVTEALAKIRTRIGDSAKLIMMIPISGKGRIPLMDAFKSYKNSGSGDANAYLVDLGNITFSTADGQHPTAAGHQSVYRAALPKLDPLVQGTP
jgi:lysophospholipase L1-like esterase